MDTKYDTILYHKTTQNSMQKIQWSAMKYALHDVRRDLGAGVNPHILSQRKKNMGGNKKFRYQN